MKPLFLLFAFLSLFGASERNAKNTTDENRRAEPAFAAEKEAVDPDGLITIPIFSKCSDYNNNLSVIADDISFIRMDKDPPYSDEQISDIALSENNIFFHSTYAIYSYDSAGKFIRMIGSSGQGPREYVQITNKYFVKMSL